MPLEYGHDLRQRFLRSAFPGRDQCPRIAEVGEITHVCLRPHHEIGVAKLGFLEEMTRQRIRQDRRRDRVAVGVGVPRGRGRVKPPFPTYGGRCSRHWRTRDYVSAKRKACAGVTFACRSSSSSCTTKHAASRHQPARAWCPFPCRWLVSGQKIGHRTLADQRTRSFPTHSALINWPSASSSVPAAKLGCTMCGSTTCGIRSASTAHRPAFPSCGSRSLFGHSTPTMTLRYMKVCARELLC